MRHLTFFVQWISLLALFGVFAFAGESVFVPTEEQRVLLREGAKYVKELEEQYSNLTMLGTTEHFYSDKPEEQQRHTTRFRFVRIGHEYCLLESQTAVPGLGNGKPDVFHTCNLINPKANYRFTAEGQNDNPTFALVEKTKIENHDHSVRDIDYLVHANWETGSAPYCVSVDLLCPFDIVAARAASPKQGGYIKGIAEEVIEGKRVVFLKMGYYYGDTESSGEVSFYPDHYWAVKDAMIEGINGNTEKIDWVFKTSNVYDFSDTFPMLKKTTIETWDATGKKLINSQISSITSIDFTVPDVSNFDPKRYEGNANDRYPSLSKRRFSSWQCAGILIGILLIVWGFLMRRKENRG